MKLYIQIRNGQPYEHPIIEENLLQAFPDFDVNNLPSEYAVFERLPIPNFGFYEKYSHTTYEFVNGVVRDVHHIVPMTDEEVSAKNQTITEAVNATVALYREKAEQNLARATEQEIKDFWQAYLDRLNSWTLTDFANPDIPVPGAAPRPNLNNPGATPDVVG